MIKVSIFLTRRPDLTREEFVTYWTNKHTPLLATLPPGALQVHRYVQLQPTDDEIPGIGTAVYDGVAELWVDSVADAAAWFTSETYNSEIAADEENFLDRSATRFLYSKTVPGSGLGRFDPARRFVGAGADTGPGRQLPGGREASRINPTQIGHRGRARTATAHEHVT